jgi:hypothetical protein
MQIEVLKRFSINTSKLIWRIKLSEDNKNIIGRIIKYENYDIAKVNGFTLFAESNDYIDAVTINRNNYIYDCIIEMYNNVPENLTTKSFYQFV